MKFNSAEEIYDTINSGTDLYFLDSGIYVFDYAARGSIAYYYLGMDELLELAQEVYPDYVAGALGPGGYIVDPDIRLDDGEIIEYGNPYYGDYDRDGTVIGGDYDFTPIYDFLERFVGEECISAMPEDLLKGE